MKRHIFFVALIFALAPLASHAEEVNLGSFSIDEIQKITGAPINFHFAGKTITADKNVLAGFLKIRPALRDKRGLFFRSGEYQFHSDQ